MITLVLAILISITTTTAIAVCIILGIYTRNTYHKQLNNKLKEALKSPQCWEAKDSATVILRIGKIRMTLYKNWLPSQSNAYYAAQCFRPSVVTAIKVVLKTNKVLNEAKELRKQKEASELTNILLTE